MSLALECCIVDSNHCITWHDLLLVLTVYALNTFLIFLVNHLCQISCSLTCVHLQNARIILDDSEVILHSADSIASVGILHPRAFHLEQKPDSSDRIGDDSAVQESSSCVYEVDEVTTHDDVGEKQALSPAVDAYTNVDLCISKTGNNLRSMSCWIQDPSRASEGAYHILCYSIGIVFCTTCQEHLITSIVFLFVELSFNVLLHR